jgi:hypothetical protein
MRELPRELPWEAWQSVWLRRAWRIVGFAWKKLGIEREPGRIRFFVEGSGHRLGQFDEAKADIWINVKAFEDDDEEVVATCLHEAVHASQYGRGELFNEVAAEAAATGWLADAFWEDYNRELAKAEASHARPARPPLPGAPSYVPLRPHAMDELPAAPHRAPSWSFDRRLTSSSEIG